MANEKNDAQQEQLSSDASKKNNNSKSGGGALIVLLCIVLIAAGTGLLYKDVSRNYRHGIYRCEDGRMMEEPAEPDSGKILAMVSKPDFDPNTVSENWAEISADKEKSPLVNRATQGLYPPGSTFKIVTALEYLREGHSLRDSFTCKGSYTNDGYTVHCAANEKHGEETTESAFANSCNVAFSQMSGLHGQN